MAHPILLYSTYILSCRRVELACNWQILAEDVKKRWTKLTHVTRGDCVCHTTTAKASESREKPPGTCMFFGALTSSSRLAPEIRGSISTRSLVALSAKKSMKTSHSCCSRSCSGSFPVGFTNSRSSMARKTFLVRCHSQVSYHSAATSWPRHTATGMPQ